MKLTKKEHFQFIKGLILALDILTKYPNSEKELLEIIKKEMKIYKQK